MTIRDFLPALSASFVMLALAACSDRSGDPGRERTDTVPQELAEFSEEDKRVASALYPSRNDTLTQAKTPYAQSILCRHGTDVLALRLGDAVGLTEPQRAAMEQARAYFAQQSSALGEAAGKSVEEINSDLEKVAEENVNESDSILIAISCLRKLQENG